MPIKCSTVARARFGTLRLKFPIAAPGGEIERVVVRPWRPGDVEHGVYDEADAFARITCISRAAALGMDLVDADGLLAERRRISNPVAERPNGAPRLSVVGKGAR